MGKTRQRLALAIAEVTGLKPETIKLWGAKGWYRTRFADCQPYTGSGETPEGFRRSIGSWDTMSNALTFGFVVHENAEMGGGYSDFEVCPMSPKQGSKIGDGMGFWLPPRKRSAISPQPSTPEEG